MPRPTNTDERRAQIARGLVQVMARRGYDGASVRRHRQRGAADAGAASTTTSRTSRRSCSRRCAISVARHDARLDARLAAAAGDPAAEVAAFIDFHLGLGADADPEALACWILLERRGAARAADRAELREGARRHGSSAWPPSSAAASSGACSPAPTRRPRRQRCWPPSRATSSWPPPRVRSSRAARPRPPPSAWRRGCSAPRCRRRRRPGRRTGAGDGTMNAAAKLGLLGALYFSQGLPFGFFTQALPVLLRKQRLLAGRDRPDVAAGAAVGAQVPVGAGGRSLVVAAPRSPPVVDRAAAAGGGGDRWRRRRWRRSSARRRRCWRRPSCST